MRITKEKAREIVKQFYTPNNNAFITPRLEITATKILGRTEADKIRRKTTKKYMEKLNIA